MVVINRYLLGRGEWGEMSRMRLEPLDKNHSFILSMIIQIKIVNQYGAVFNIFNKKF